MAASGPHTPPFGSVQTQPSESLYYLESQFSEDIILYLGLLVVWFSSSVLFKPSLTALYSLVEEHTLSMHEVLGPVPSISI